MAAASVPAAEGSSAGCPRCGPGPPTRPGTLFRRLGPHTSDCGFVQAAVGPLLPHCRGTDEGAAFGPIPLLCVAFETALLLLLLALNVAAICPQGFQVLVETEWLEFGHKFADRCGHGENSEDLNERCPVFLQWLDCVHQLQRQFPCSFEFNEAFLVCVLVWLLGGSQTLCALWLDLSV